MSRTYILPSFPSSPSLHAPTMNFFSSPCTHLVSSAHWWLQHTWMLSPPLGTCHGGYGAVIPSWNGEGGGGWFQGLLSSTPPSHPGTTSVSPSKPSKHQIWWTGQEDYGEHCNCVASTLLVHNQYTIVCALLTCQDAVVTTVGKSVWNSSLGFNVWAAHSLPGAWPSISLFRFSSVRL